VNSDPPPEYDAGLREFLRACSDQYDFFVEGAKEVSRRGSPEAVLDWVQTAANFAAMHHPGRFADGALENVALEVGRQLESIPGPACEAMQIAVGKPRAVPARRRVLHVATTIVSIGGHTRTILNWIRKDPHSEHSLVTTTSTNVVISEVLSDAVVSTGGQVFVLPDKAPLVSRARWLREFSAARADLVFLHLTPYDVVPVAAFAAPGGPPVALINLADQCYWLGSTVADSVVHLREIGATTSREIRFTRNDLMLPIPLFETRADFAKDAARRALQIPESQLMLLTVGRCVKFAPSARHNFFRAACAILRKNPQAHIYLVGVAAGDHASHPDFVSHERMHFVGPVDDATAHQRAADIYLEGFPFGSQTALLEAAMLGTACVPAFAPATPLLATQDFALDGVAENTADEADYIDRASGFAADPQKRNAVGAALRERVLHYHVLDSWNAMLEEVYSALASLPHAPVELPATRGSARPVDLAISEYHATRFPHRDKRALVEEEVRGRITYSAYYLRRRGFHADAFRLLRIANRNRKWNRESLVYAAKILPDWLLFGMRRLFSALRAR
jgi:glycosyltransferase involved in cell wall biosynthesis